MRRVLMVLCFLPLAAMAQLTVNKFFTDHMMLQREKSIKIDGKAKPGTRISIQFKGKIYTGTTGRDSSWQVWMGPFAADGIGAELSIHAGRESLQVKDIVLGDLWLCLGQSNMEWPMLQEMHFAEARLAAADSGLRLFDAAYAGQGIFGQRFSDSVLSKLNARDFYEGRWERSDSNTINSMSAVGWWFGKRVRETVSVPIGLINLAIGGAPLETFHALQEQPLAGRVGWLNNNALPVWVRERGLQNLGPGNPDADHAFKPGFAFEAGLRALGDFPIKGILWYQGESNAQEPESVKDYNRLAGEMVQAYRRHWKDSTLPFYYVQLSSIDSTKYKSRYWPWFRDQQRLFLKQLDHVGMAVSSDHGAYNDVHPRNKKIVGQRLALWALHDVYGLPLVPSGPLAQRAVWYGGKLVVSFRHTAQGLDGDVSKGFSLDGITPAMVRINGRVVEIGCPLPPQKIFYGWKPFSDGALVNAEGLPASTFQLDVEPLSEPLLHDSLFGTYYHQRRSLLKALPSKRDEIIFLGNSITDGGEWADLFQDQRLSNFGISGDISAGVLHRMADIAERQPSKLFILIGVNDLARGLSIDSITRNYWWMLEKMRRASPHTKIFFQSVLPVNNVYGKFGGHTSKMKEIKALNQWLEEHADELGYTYVDLHSVFADAEGKLRKELTNDGLHLLGEGYREWRRQIFPLVTGTAMHPSLIPLPEKVEWRTGYLRIKDPVDSMPVPSTINKNYSDEEYDISVSESGISLIGGSTTALYYGMQTLRQLAVNGVSIPAVHIHDKPAFPYRGFMTDVGRNYQGLGMLKEMIDVMARYKLNVFHLHLTEDIAWRIEVPGFPQLTAASGMLRNKGAYYSVEEIRNLQAYCSNRGIRFLPEIDMPGHSAAFERAMGVPMQSPEGIAILKRVLDTVIAVYGFKAIHIGGDEVKIKDNQFLPVILNHLRSKGVEITSWDPGVVRGAGIRKQLWMREGPLDPSVQYIDSRHSYLNHMDPLEGVVTLFQRKIGGKDSADKSLLGGTICVWHDRNLLKEEDILRMNPVYPGMLAFAERSWRGGGISPWTAFIKDSIAFAAFEQRLMDHRTLFFNDKIFPYLQQHDLSWKIHSSTDTLQAVGGTIVLRHFWHPLVEGVLQERQANMWTATTRIWSNADTTLPFWIGFHDLSRSYTTHTPPAGKWNEAGATVQVNGAVIPPPAWKRAGARGDLEQPLLDEGYSYRPPTMVKMKRGWNDVRLTLPWSTASSSGNPFKYMFTFVPYR